MIGISPGQLRCLTAIREHVMRTGLSPTYRDLCTALGVSSTNAINDLVRALERKGYVTRARLLSRTLQLTAKARRVFAPDEEIEIDGGPFLGELGRDELGTRDELARYVFIRFPNTCTALEAR